MVDQEGPQQMQQNDSDLADVNNEEGQKETSVSYHELMKKLGDSEQAVHEQRDRMLRIQADAENARQRAEREAAKTARFVLEKFSSELLPVIDSLELCVTNKAQHGVSSATQAFIDGVALTLKMFYATLEKFGIKQIDPVAEVFNPELHQAISVQFDAAVPPLTVLSVLQKGYVLHERLLRPALVVVSKTEEN